MSLIQLPEIKHLLAIGVGGLTGFLYGGSLSEWGWKEWT